MEGKREVEVLELEPGEAGGEGERGGGEGDA